MTSEWIGVARRQAGAISWAQLLAAGLSDGQVRRLVDSGALRRATRGVYLVAGTDPTWRCRLWIGLLEAGPGSFACRRSAAALWELDGVSAGEVEIGVPPGRHPRRPGTARLKEVGPGCLTVHEGVPLTGVARTLADLGAVVDAQIVERSLECALRRRLVTLREVTSAVGVRSGGSRVLGRVLSGRPPGAPPTDSDAETLFVLLARSAGLPMPVRQHRVILRGRAYRLDFAWPLVRLAVEIDGASFHGPDAFEADVYRQNRFLVDGWVILRFTWRMLVYTPAVVVRDFRVMYERCSIGVA